MHLSPPRSQVQILGGRGPLERAVADTKGGIFKAKFVLRSIFLISYQAFFLLTVSQTLQIKHASLSVKKLTVFSPNTHTPSLLLANGVSILLIEVEKK